MDHIINVEGVSKSYTNHRALDAVSLDIPFGGVYGLLGPNGAGKTTLIRMLTHITAPDTGQILFKGKPLTSADVCSIGYLPEERGLYKKMRVGEQALFFARLKGLGKHEATVRLHEWMDRLGILDWWDKKVEELSKGMAQKLQFVITVLHDPELLIFDEPFSGFDPINADMLKTEILRLRDMGKTIIFSTHNMTSVEEICDNITLINNGRNILSGNVEELRRRHSDGRFTVSYMGDDADTLERLDPYVAALARTVTPDGLVSLDLRLRPDATLRPVLSTLNTKLDIRGVSAHRASMDEIFINAVNSDLNGTK